MKKALLFIVVFIFIYPIFPSFFPIPLDRILQVFGVFVLFFNPGDLKKVLSDKLFYRFYGVTSILLLLTLFAQYQLSRGLDLYFFKEVFDAYLTAFSAYLVCWAMKRAYGYVSMGLVLYYISLAAIAQTFISFVFFVTPSVFDAYISILKVETNQGLFNRTTTISKRFIGFGSQFFSGVIKYGIAFMSILILPYVYSNKHIKNKFLYWVCVCFVGIGGILTGRTFFLAIGMGLFTVFMLRSKNLLSFLIINIKGVIGVSIAFVMFILLTSTVMNAEQFENMFNFVFELFINFFESDSLETTSTNAMINMYVWPENMQTWLFGDGKMQGDFGGYYMGTDIGYIRLLFYFGLPSTLFFIYVLFKYYRILGGQINIRPLKYLFLFIVVWILTLNLKGLAFESHYFVLFLFILLFEKFKRRKLVKNVS